MKLNQQETEKLTTIQKIDQKLPTQFYANPVTAGTNRSQNPNFTKLKQAIKESFNIDMSKMEMS